MNIYEVAELAGVSIATVSKVINGKSDISQATKDKVLKIMEENNYKPRLSAVNVRNIAVFAPLGNNRQLTNPYFSRILSGIGDVAFDHDYSITLVSTLRIPRNKQSFNKYCQQRKIYGGIFVLSSLEDTYIANFAGKQPLVVLSRRFDNIASVEPDNEAGGYDAVKHLIDYGHRDILFVVPSLSFHDHVMRIRGAERALQEAGLHKHPASLNDSLLLSDTDYGHYLKNLVQQKSMPTAMFVADDHEAIRTMRLLGELGVKIPDDLSIVGYDDLYFSTNITPSLTTVYQPTYEVGKEACRMLIGMMENHDKPQDQRLIIESTKLIIRNSTRALTER
ncbi:LacI family DNA-binding transcriptional regulator [Paenibacillus sp. 1P07SE]|uniref:LacI family DNA-binding transcriptional regulator n=1 Tax=Paenibacillus sp. 1P07SE TaxID=3132209 RepID=UPI0039A570B1